MRSRNILHSAFILGRATCRDTCRGTFAGTLAGAHAGTLAGAHAGTLTGTRHWSGCSSNCWAVTTTPQIWEAGRPRPQEKAHRKKALPGRLPGHLPGQTPGHLLGQILGQKLGILTLIPDSDSDPINIDPLCYPDHRYNYSCIYVRT